MSYALCIDGTCDGTLPVCQPAGHDKEFPWMLRHHCTLCGIHWFTCNKTCGTTKPQRRKRNNYNMVYRDYKSAKRHCKLPHSELPTEEPIVVEEDSYQEYPTFDGEVVLEEEVNDIRLESKLTTSDSSNSPSVRFQKLMVNGEAVLAASVLVAQALFQTPGDMSVATLPLPNIMLFLYLAKLVLSSGGLPQHNLSKVLAILYPFAVKCEPEWAPLPVTVSGFQSRILNPSNSNSMMTILPIPTPETLPDGHGYTPFRAILRHALMMIQFDPADIKDPKWESIAHCKKFQDFVHSIVDKSDSPLTMRQIAIGVIVWTDGWDTSTGCKSNRSPMHTGTITLVFVDVGTGDLVGITTYPNLGGPGKLDHGPVFERFQKDIADFEKEGGERGFSSRHFSSEVEVHARVMFLVQDQPERRGASGLLGGGSTLHPLFGTLCDFKRLENPFVACEECETGLLLYLEVKDWTLPPMSGQCEHCLGWSLNRIPGTSYTQ